MLSTSPKFTVANFALKHAENGFAAVLAGVEILASIALFHYCTWVIGPGIETPWDAFAYLGTLTLCGAYVLFTPSPGSGKPLILSVPKSGFAGLVIFLAVTLMGLAVLWLIRSGSDPDWIRFAVDAARYLALAAVQVIWLYLFLLPRIRQLLSVSNAGAQALANGAVCLLLAMIFAFNHLPNPMLMACSGVIGVVWACVYLHYPNPYLLTLSHAVLASGYVHLLGGSIRVGPGYLNPTHNAFNNSLQLIFNLAYGVF